jgi:hypothetical protein
METAIVNMDLYRIVRMGDYETVGECNRCGECCIGAHVPFKRDPSDPFPLRCAFLVCDQVDDDGNRFFRCECYDKRPVGCALWPQPDSKVPEDCGLGMRLAED